MAKFCSSCGAKLLEGQRFCPNCGEKILPLPNVSEMKKPNMEDISSSSDSDVKANISDKITEAMHKPKHLSPDEDATIDIPAIPEENYVPVKRPAPKYREPMVDVDEYAGLKLDPIDIDSNTYERPVTNRAVKTETPKKKTPVGLIIALAVLVVLFIAVVVVMIIGLGRHSVADKPQTPAVTEAPQVEATEEPEINNGEHLPGADVTFNTKQTVERNIDSKGNVTGMSIKEYDENGLVTKLYNLTTDMEEVSVRYNYDDYGNPDYIVVSTGKDNFTFELENTYDGSDVTAVKLTGYKNDNEIKDGASLAPVNDVVNYIENWVNYYDTEITYVINDNTNFRVTKHNGRIVENVSEIVDNINVKNYDEYGNLTYSETNKGKETYTYDNENKLLTVKNDVFDGELKYQNGVSDEDADRIMVGFVGEKRVVDYYFVGDRISKINEYDAKENFSRIIYFDTKTGRVDTVYLFDSKGQIILETTNITKDSDMVNPESLGFSGRVDHDNSGVNIDNAWDIDSFDLPDGIESFIHHLNFSMPLYNHENPAAAGANVIDRIVGAGACVDMSIYPVDYEMSWSSGDPWGWATDGMGYTKTSVNSVNWLLKNIFNLTDSQIEEVNTDGLNFGYYYIDGDYYYAPIGGVGGPSYTIEYSSVKFDGQYYYISYKYNIEYETTDDYARYYNAVLEYKNVDGTSYWSILSQVDA